jgi:hypothetical protein
MPAALPRMRHSLAGTPLDHNIRKTPEGLRRPPLGAQAFGYLGEPRMTDTINLDSADRVVTPCPACSSGERIYIGGGWVEREVRDRRCHPDQLSDWAQEGIRRHDARRKRAQAWMADPANAEAVAIIQAMLNGEVIP